MARIPIGKIPISKGEYVEGMTCQKLWQVTDRGSTFQSRVDNNTTRPTALDADGRVVKVHTDLWLCVADATEAVNATEDMAKVKREWADEKADIDAKQEALAAQSAKAVSDNEDATAKAKKATEDINAAIQAGATSGSAVGVAEAVTYDNSKSGLEGNNLQKVVDEAYRRSNVSDDEGNIVPNSSIHKIEDNPEYIETHTDSIGRLIEAFGVDGIKKFFTAIEVMGTLFKAEKNPEFLSTEVDEIGHILGGWKIDGDYFFGAGVPSQILHEISNADKANISKTKELIAIASTANSLEIDTDNEGNVYATIGIDGNLDVESDDEGNVFLTYDTSKVNIDNIYEDEEGNLVVEQNKVMTI